MKLAALGADEGLVVQAVQQSAGRGRQGRAWDSLEGNLHVSFLLKPDCDAKNIGQLAILIGVAVAEAIQEMCSGEPCLKWPNDVLLKGQKCAGILVNTDLVGGRVEWAVIGVGVNTAKAPEGAVSLGCDRDLFLNEMLEQVKRYYTVWKDKGFEDIRAKWLEKTYQQGSALNVGVFEDIDEYGNLVVRTPENQLQTISTGDVFLKDG